MLCLRNRVNFILELLRLHVWLAFCLRYPAAPLSYVASVQVG